MSVNRMTTEKKKEIFMALVVAQDSQRMTVAESERKIAGNFGITKAQLKEIIEEGTDKSWLDELMPA